MNIRLSAIIVTFFYFLGTFDLIARNPVTIFSHGIKDSYKQAFWYAQHYEVDGTVYHNERYLFSRPFVTFNYPDAHGGFKETSLGQDNEIARLNTVYNRVMQDLTDTILIGLSRGASAVFNFVGKLKPVHVKAIVAESPYDATSTMIDVLLQQFNLWWLPHSYGEYLAELVFRKYKRDGIQPRDVLSDISHDIPILIICSREDIRVPYTSSFEIYKKLREFGHQDVYIFIADHGKHAKILVDRDGEKYQAIVHAFFEKYNLPHNATIAKKGKKYLEQCQPVF